MPDGKTLCAGDSILFALAYSEPSQETCYVKGGDSVCVSLTEVTELGGTDPATGQALFRLSWRPPGQSGSSGTVAERNVKSRGAWQSIAEKRGEDEKLRWVRCQGEFSIRSHPSGRRYAVCFPSRLTIGCGRVRTHIRIHKLDDPRMAWPEILNRSFGQNVRTVGGMKL